MIIGKSEEGGILSILLWPDLLNTIPTSISRTKIIFKVGAGPSGTRLALWLAPIDLFKSDIVSRTFEINQT